MSDQFTASIVSIGNTEGRIFGTGFLISGNRIVTCAHVVSKALDIPKDTPEMPGGVLRVGFPLISKGEITSHETITSRVIFWSPVSEPPVYGSDIAVLKLDADPPEGSHPGELVPKGSLWRHPFRAFGFPPKPSPKDPDIGVWAFGVILDKLANGWVEIEVVKVTGHGVEPGFSGSPVWDDEENGIVGMVVASELQSHIRTAYIIPVNLLIEVYPELSQKQIPPSPYRGLFAFEEKHAPYFFGRDYFIQKLIEAVRKSPLVSVTGPSGSGKSSVVFAGLIPHLRHEGKWLIASFRPGRLPFFNLASALFSLVESRVEEGIADPVKEKSNLAERIRQKENGLQELVIHIMEEHPDCSALILVADQFEELFTLCQEEEERSIFLERLLAATSTGSYQKRPALNLVITLRADFFGYATSYRPLADALQNANLILGPMNRKEMQAAIEKPAQKHKVSMEDGLPERILEAISHTPGKLPLLQFAMAQMWDKQKSGKLTHAAYNETGGVEKSLARYAESFFNKLNKDEKESTQRIFTQLVRPGMGTEDTLRITTRQEVGESNWAMASHLADARLIVCGHDETTGEETLEIVHEALIREWKRLRDWINSDRTFRIWQEWLRAVIQQWESCGKDEGALLRGAPLVEAEEWLQKRLDDLNDLERTFIQAGLDLRAREQTLVDRRRRRKILWITTGMVVALILATLASLAFWYAEIHRKYAEEQHQIALARQLIAQSELTRNLEPNLLPCSVLLATEAMQRLMSNYNQDVTAVAFLEVDQALRVGMELLPLNLACISHNNQDVTNVAFSPDGEYLATASADHMVRLWRWKTDKDKEIARMGHAYSVTALAFSPDGAYLASASDDNSARLWDVPGGRQIARMNHLNNVTAIAFSPDGDYLATASADMTARIWEIPRGKEKYCIDHEDYISAITFSPDGEYLATTSWDKTARVWSMSTGRETSRMIHDDIVTAIAFSPDGKNLATSNPVNKAVQIWEIRDKREIVRMVHDSDVIGITYSPDGEYLATMGNDYTARIWRLSTGQEIRRMSHKDTLTGFTFSPEGRYLATASQDATARVWDIRYGREVIRMTHNDGVNDIVFSKDGEYLATASRDATAQVWEMTSIRKDTCMAHDAKVTDLSFSPDGSYLASISNDHTVRIWETNTCKEVAILRHEWAMRSVSFSPDGRYLATASGDHVVRIWEAATGKETGCLNHGAGVSDVLFSPDGRHLVTVGSDRLLVVWKARSRHKIAGLMHDSIITAVSFSPDGRYVATATKDGKITVWKAGNTNPIAGMRHPGEITAIAFSPDGSCLAVASRDSIASIWNVSNSQRISSMMHDAGIVAIVFSPDGKRLVTASVDGTARIWFANNGQEIFSLRHHGEVAAVSFSPDGQHLATGSRDHTARIWDARHGNEITRMDHSEEVVSVAFSPDGNHLATASRDRIARVWRADKGEEVARMFHPGEVTMVVFSPDGSGLSTIVRGDPYARIWDAGSGLEISKIKHAWHVNTLEFSHDGRYLATSGDDRTTRIWDVGSWEERTRIIHENPVKALAFSPDPGKSHIAAAIRESWDIRLWNAASGQEIISLRQEGGVKAFNFSPDGRYIAVTSGDRTVRVCDASTGLKVISLKHPGNVNALSFCPDGRYLATACKDRTAWVWDSSTGQMVHCIRHEKDKLDEDETEGGMNHNKKTWHLGDVTISPNGKYLATVCIEGMAWIWDMANGLQVASLKHEDVLNAIAFSPDGGYVATSSEDHTARIWKLLGGQEIARLNHRLGVNDVAFNPDGKYVVTAGSDQIVRRWIWQPKDMIAETCKRLCRNLTKQEWQQYIGNEPYRKTCPEISE